MTAQSLPPAEPIKTRAGWPLAVGLLIIELVLISVLYKNNFTFTCRDVAPAFFCAFAGHIVPRALGTLAALALFAMAYGGLIREVLSAPGPRRMGLTLNLSGLALTLAPWFFVTDASALSVVALGAIAWLLGAALAATGAALILAPWSALQRLLREKGALLAALMATGMVLPEVVLQLKPIWHMQWVTEVTFDAVTRVLIYAGYTVDSYAAEKVIGIVDSDPNQNFYIAIGSPCSGLEGFLLISVFLSIFMLLFRRDLAFPAALALFPIGICVCWGFNILRIAGLLSLGYHTSPSHTASGFHSHAGWFAFTLLSLLLIVLARRVPFFHKP